MNKNNSPLKYLAAILFLFVLLIAVGRFADGTERVSLNERAARMAAQTTLPVSSSEETAPAADLTEPLSGEISPTAESPEETSGQPVSLPGTEPSVKTADRKNLSIVQLEASLSAETEATLPEETAGESESSPESMTETETVSEAAEEATDPSTEVPTTAAPSSAAPTTAARPTAAASARTGFFYENGILHYNNAKGQPVTGWGTYKGRTYYFKNGTPGSGLTWIDGKLYCLSDGLPVTGWRSFSDGKRYFTASGAAAIGFADIDGSRYYFDGNGRMQLYYQTIGGKRYYFYSDGKMARNTVIEIYQADENGVLTNRFSEISEDNLDEYIAYLVRNNGNTPEKIYNYVKKNYLIRDTAKASIREMAIHILNTGSGACYNYASLAILMLQQAGYKARLVTGESRHAAEHDWVLYEPQPGVWRHMDPYRNWLSIYAMTDALLEKYDDFQGCSYIWDRNLWTSTTPSGYGATVQTDDTTAASQTDPAQSEPVTEPTVTEPSVPETLPTEPEQTTPEGETASTETEPETQPTASEPPTVTEPTATEPASEPSVTEPGTEPSATEPSVPETLPTESETSPTVPAELPTEPAETNPEGGESSSGS